MPPPPIMPPPPGAPRPGPPGPPGAPAGAPPGAPPRPGPAAPAAGAAAGVSPGSVTTWRSNVLPSSRLSPNTRHGHVAPALAGALVALYATATTPFEATGRPPEPG